MIELHAVRIYPCLLGLTVETPETWKEIGWTCSAHAAQLDRTATLFGRWILMDMCYKALNKLKGRAKTEKSTFPATSFSLSHNNITTTINEINLKIKKNSYYNPTTLNHQILYTMYICKSILVFY